MSVPSEAELIQTGDMGHHDQQIASHRELTHSHSNTKPLVIGLYGLPGSGKTFLLEQLQGELGQQHFAFYEGSEVIENVVPGGLTAFQALDDAAKEGYRRQAIRRVSIDCANSGHVGVVTGHFMFWHGGRSTGTSVLTDEDLKVFTHILYLDIPPKTVAQQRSSDHKKFRPQLSVEQLQEWQQTEKTELRMRCRQHGILFALAFSPSSLHHQIARLLEDFGQHTEEFNLSCTISKLDDVMRRRVSRAETVIVLDADRTLAPEDTGALFWKTAFSARLVDSDENVLKTLFDSALGYSYTAFRQATLLYEELPDEDTFTTVCQEVASLVRIYPEFRNLLRQATTETHIQIFVVTSGIRCVWEMIMAREGFSQSVTVIGGGRVSDGIVVNAATKRAVVGHLRKTYSAFIWAFGDSPLDLEMLREADQAVVVVGEEKHRSKTMEHALSRAIDQDGLKARQVLIPSDALPRLSKEKLPIIQLTDEEVLRSILRRRDTSPSNVQQLYHATDKSAAKLLMTPMRDAAISGARLREAHRQAGWYLATEFLATIVGTEEYQTQHVQGHYTSGFRLLDEGRTVVVALMRGGEPMAFGVSDAFPLAMFVHANRPGDLMPHHLTEARTVVLVDSVINSGKSISQFMEHICSMNSGLRIIVIAGVVQAQSVDRLVSRWSEVKIVALRLSNNKFTGTGTTDTGNRLFNTTHLP